MNKDSRSKLKLHFPNGYNHSYQIPYPFKSALRPPALPSHIDLQTQTYQDIFHQVLRERSKDNHQWAIAVLEMILDLWPWQKESLDLWSFLKSRTNHLRTPMAFYRRMVWQGMEEWKVIHKTGPSRVDENVERMVILRGHIQAYLQDRGINNAFMVDVAAGQGDTTFQWAELPQVEYVVGMEICEIYSLLAMQYYRHHKIQYMNGMAEHLPIKDSVADVVILSAVLEHVIDPDKLVQEAERIGKDGALIAINVPYGGFEHNNPMSAPLFFYDHVRTYDIVELLLTKKDPVLHYVDYHRNPFSDWALWDLVGDFMGSYILSK